MLKILLLGDSSVGKTCIFQQYVNKKVDLQTQKPTIGCDFIAKEIMIDNTTVTMQVWDTAGQEKYQSLGYSYYRGTDCVAFVYDITSRKSFESIERWVSGFIEHAAPSDPASFPFICVGNKLDLEPQRQVATAQAKNWCSDNWNMSHTEISATENYQVDDIFIELAKKAMQNQSNLQLQIPGTIGGASGAIKLSAKDSGSDKKKKKCC